MKARSTHVRGFRLGFTVIELLVVIAVIALLAALLLPVLARGKANAKSAACKGNLRQLGLALNMYVSDYDKYPGNAALYNAYGFAGIYGNGMNWLNPYLGGHWDPGLNLDWHYHFASKPTVFSCPAEPPRNFGGFLSFPAFIQYDLGYGYNELGTGWKNDKLRLGLGFTVDFEGSDANSLPLGARHYVTPGQIKSPGDMIAIGEGASWLAPNNPGSGVLNFTNGTVTAPHNDGANIAFCDGHVEYGKRKQWVGTPDARWRRWNNDNQPHPETW